MKRLHLGVAGFGRLGRACVEAIRVDEQLVLAGIVCRDPKALLPERFSQTPVVAHISELVRVDAALICVPVTQVPGGAHDLLQRGVPIAECACLHGLAVNPGEIRARA